ncbi:MAG: GNAT family acetyltransferase [Halioglobus sp.]|jgi:ribosomal protein S18 acetylase RimI-like enzyme|uniref:GNAT family acetyltransferase n=1 Tax=Candidatus Seongchinamella marina TaxID=2518990 RepID=A0ABT3SXR1_9GAMM|nr:GNAT family acetyltransferase [Candidatus Seongchinamella marina]EEB77952.1 acetyltransferase, GNAT family [marine gamma proteobacterium HTCC2148]MBT7718326.1 GNAT family acetyltransferase [Halieaceae bacterium]MDG1387320.1 GNAT family acetyltransferase [Halioglobus sp.]MCX2974785.1 GNAT family acetyltransferase [Candidatus Seongchinamella marina]MDG2327004.1 GNAT family acetyltransferase [Halioglobus sp.]
MNIRTYQDSDEDAVIGLWNECGLVVAHNDPRKDIARKLEVGRDLFLVGVVNDQIVASVMGGYDGHRGWVNYLAVSPDQQRKSYGTVMMRAIEKILLVRGCPKLNLQVRRANTAIIDFYNSIGYGEDAVVSMGKRLIPDH